ncbi:hypothetical protein [Flavobacterium sp.]|uniref:hypothetical protein n=1 Tax=Flavobacterium sp. TaxID=239 RepID=UPI003F69EEB5
MLLNKDQNGNVTYGLPCIIPEKGGIGYEVFLTVPAEVTLTVPENVNLAVMSYSERGVRFRNSVAAIPPPTGVFSQTNVELNPLTRIVSPGDILRFEATINGTRITVAFWNTSG